MMHANWVALTSPVRSSRASDVNTEAASKLPNLQTSKPPASGLLHCCTELWPTSAVRTVTCSLSSRKVCQCVRPRGKYTADRSPKDSRNEISLLLSTTFTSTYYCTMMRLDIISGQQGSSKVTILHITVNCG